MLKYKKIIGVLYATKIIYSVTDKMFTDLLRRIYEKTFN